MKDVTNVSVKPSAARLFATNEVPFVKEAEVAVALSAEALVLELRRSGKGAPPEAVKFQSCQGCEAVSVHDVECVMLVQNGDDVTFVGALPEISPDIDVAVMLLVVVDVKLLDMDSVPGVVVFDCPEVVNSADELVTVLSDPDDELSVGTELVKAEMRDELDNPVDEPEV